MSAQLAEVRSLSLSHVEKEDPSSLRSGKTVTSCIGSNSSTRLNPLCSKMGPEEGRGGRHGQELVDE